MDIADPRIEAYAEAHTAPPAPHLVTLAEETTAALSFPQMMVGPLEGRFLEMSQTLNAEPQTFGYPPAALLAFCLGLVASNAVALLTAAVRSAHGKKAASELS